MDCPGCSGFREAGGGREAKDPGWSRGTEWGKAKVAVRLHALREDVGKRREKELDGLWHTGKVIGFVRGKITMDKIGQGRERRVVGGQVNAEAMG